MNFARALAMMRTAHAGKLDRAGKPYWEHPVRVMGRLGSDASENAKMVALLHDAVEDSGFTISDLRAAGFPPAVVDAVALLTRVPGGSYAAYIDRIAASGNAMAVRVKLADLADNLDPARAGARPASLSKRYLAARAKLAAL